MWYLANKKTGIPIKIEVGLDNTAIGFPTKKALLNACEDEIYTGEEIRKIELDLP